MQSRALSFLILSGALALSACETLRGPSVPHPLAGQSRYLCCNLHYERPKINDANYQKGTLVPFGTRVQILEVRGSRVKFQPEGHPALTYVYRYGKNGVPFETHLDRLFVASDPRATLATPKSAKRKDAAAADETRKLIEQGTVVPGMTRTQVLMAIGYPPAHRTPSLEGPTWTYWENRVVTFEVHFDGERVSRVSR
jgi:hypothetical protein